MSQTDSHVDFINLREFMSSDQVFPDGLLAGEINLPNNPGEVLQHHRSHDAFLAIQVRVGPNGGSESSLHCYRGFCCVGLEHPNQVLESIRVTEDCGKPIGALRV